jgi:hypothetical protein
LAGWSTLLFNNRQRRVPHQHADTCHVGTCRRRNQHADYADPNSSICREYSSSDYNAIGGEAAPTSTPEADIAPTATSEAAPTSAPEADIAPTATSEVVATEPQALKSGAFTRVDNLHVAEGVATIYHTSDGQLILRLENFKAANGPDLFVSLSGHPMPRSTAEAHESGYREIARLKASQGNQNYELPADLDISQYRSVVIYCRAFSVVFSTAELQ